MSKTTGIPVKTRLPMPAWVLAGLVTLFSLVSALVHITTIPELPVSVANQETPEIADHHANGT
jgi:hypothetical protein